MKERKTISLEEVIEKFVGKPYSRELAREIEALGFAFTTVNGRIYRIFKPSLVCNYHAIIEKVTEAKGS